LVAIEYRVTVPVNAIKALVCWIIMPREHSMQNVPRVFRRRDFRAVFCFDHYRDSLFTGVTYYKGQCSPKKVLVTYVLFHLGADGERIVEEKARR
jgi:hypothetical protein